MELLKIISLLYFLALIISINARENRGETFIRSDDMKTDEVPRIKIKVFRGASKEHDGEQFATWGFWIKQPATMKLTR